MNGFAHLSQSMQGGVLMNSHLPWASLSFPAHITMPGDDKADVSLGEICHEVSKSACASSLRGGHTFPRRGTNKPVWQAHAIDDGCFEKD
jgi:hypothetical protein